VRLLTRNEQTFRTHQEVQAYYDLNVGPFRDLTIDTAQRYHRVHRREMALFGDVPRWLRLLRLPAYFSQCYRRERVINRIYARYCRQRDAWSAAIKDAEVECQEHCQHTIPWVTG